MRAATLGPPLEDLGVLSSFFRPRVSKDNPFSESLFRIVKVRPDYARRPFTNSEEHLAWVAVFVGWYNDCDLHTGLRFLTPSQLHSGEAVATSLHSAPYYKQARQRIPRRWNRRTRCLR